jgi:hypothetical protein
MLTETEKKSNPTKNEHNWQIYNALKEQYVYLESNKHPFFNVKIYFENDIYTVVVGDGYNIYSDKDFESEDEAIDYAENKFDELTSSKNMNEKITKENPNWIKDEGIWEKAKKQSLKSYGRISYPFVVYLYKQMGGKIKKGK